MATTSSYTLLEMDGDDYNKRYEFSLSGTKFYLHVIYNSRGGWQVDLLDSSKSTLVSNIRITPYRELLHSYNIEGTYDGSIYCIDTEYVSGDDAITIDNFGTGRRFQLWYFTDSQLEDLIEVLEAVEDDS